MIHEEKNCYKIVCQSFVGRYKGRGSKTKIIVDEDSKITCIEIVRQFRIDDESVFSSYIFLILK